MSDCSPDSVLDTRCVPPSIDGILNIDKPAGVTSFDVVARVRRLTHSRRVGHAGTLDPDATGVLLVCLGQATRMVEFLSQATKRYCAEIELGSATDTFDASGQVISSCDSSQVTIEELESVLQGFKGEIRQVPPIYSALKYQGRPLYKLARAGIQIDLPARTVSVYSIDLVGWTPPTFIIDVECSKGTYIRSLANDIGKRMGCGAHLRSLVRTGCAGFRLNEAVGMPEFELAASNGSWVDHLHALDTPAIDWSAVILSDEMARMTRCGQSLALPVPSGEQDARWSCRAYDTEGTFVGILKFDERSMLWHPSKVFSHESWS